MSDGDTAKSLAALESRYAELVTKHDNTENELAFQKKRYDSAVVKFQAEKEAEIEELKAQFAAISEKRKESFIQLKEKLQQASVVVNKYADEAASHEAAMQAVQQQLAEAQRNLASREAELDSIRRSQGDTESASAQRVASLESELHALRSSSSSASSSLSELQAELDSMKAKLESAEEKAKGKPSAKCSINVEDGGADAPLFPGVLENGRTLVFKWSLSGSVRIQWYRSFRGGQFEAIPGKAATKPTYNINADDIGASLRAEATHTVTGASVFAECGPIHPSAAMISALMEPLRKLDVTYTVETSNPTDADKQRRLLLNKEKVKLQDGKGKTVAKKEWSDALKVTLDGDSDRRFAVQIEASGPVVNYTANNQRVRDLIVVTMRIFAYVITKHGGKLSKDADHLLALASHIRALNESSHLRPAPTVPASPAKRLSTSGTSTPKAGGGTGKPPPGPGGSGAKPGVAAPTPPRKPSIGGGNSQGSAPSTPQSRSIDASQSAHSNAGHGRKASGIDDDWGLPPTAQSVNGNGAAPAAAAAPSQSSSGAAATVDADGFLVTKNRGFDDYVPKAAADSDDEEAEGEEARGPAIKVQINAEARAPASADSLKSATSALQLGGAGKGKKGKKGDKKAGAAGGKKKKDGDDTPSSSNGGLGLADGGSLALGGGGASASASAASHSVPGLPPLAPSAVGGDVGDPFAEFFKSTASPKAGGDPLIDL